MPPKYEDFNKAAKDLLSKDFPVGSIKLEGKHTARQGGVTFTTTGTRDNQTGFITGEIKHKYSDGFDLTNSISTNNVLATELDIKNIIDGVKVTLNSAVEPSGKLGFKAAGQYSSEFFTTTAKVDALRSLIVGGDLVVGVNGFVVGGEIAYDTKESKLLKPSVAVGYNGDDYSVSIHANNSFRLISANYIQKVNSSVQAGGKATYNVDAKDQYVTLEVVSKYNLDKESFIKSKIDNYGKFSLGYSQELRKGVKINLGAQIDTCRLNENCHKVGMSLAFEA